MVEVIKKHWKAILAIAAAAIFIFEIIALGVLGGGGAGGGSTSTGTLETGTTEFTGTIRTYDPVILVTDLDDDAANELRAMETVESLTTSAEGTLINTETRDDVYPIGVYLREKGIEGVTVANIAMPPFVEVELGNGTKVNASAGNIAVRVLTEPIVDVDTEVRITMVVQIANGMVYTYGSPLIVTEEKEIEAESTVLEVEHIYAYLVSWEGRNSLDTGNITEFDYDRKDTVFFTEAITVEEVMEKKNLEYVEYIDQYSIECSENFTNRSAVENDFGAVTFPDSVLTIVSNESVELNYSGSVVHSYRLSLPSQADGITLDESEVELESAEFYPENSTVSLDITGTVMGNRMVAIKDVQIK